VEEISEAALDQFGRVAPGISYGPGEREEVVVRRPAALPGIELWTVKRSARLWVVYHSAYAFCTHERAGGERWRCRRRTYAVEPDAIMVFEPGEVQVTVEATMPADFHVLTVAPERLEQVLAARPTRPGGRHFPEAQLRAATARAGLEQLWQAIEGNGEDALLRELLGGFLEEIFALAGEAPAPVPATGCERAIRRAREFVQDRYADKISLDDVAREAGLSKYHLERSFTNKVGLSLYQFVKKVRINRALELLRSGLRPAEVAPLCGFSDQPHMTRVFREDLGLTPRQYWAASNKP
jgi:AraC-like DNA-binding protein